MTKPLITVIPPKPHQTIQTYQNKKLFDQLYKDKRELGDELWNLITETDVPSEHPARQLIRRIFND